MSCTTSSATAVLDTNERGQPQHRGVMARDELHERLLVAGAQSRHQLGVLVDRAGVARRLRRGTAIAAISPTCTLGDA